MMLLKPYAWLDFEARQVHVKVKVADGASKYRVTTETMDTTDSVVILVIISVTETTSTDPDLEAIYKLPEATAHKKVRVIVRNGSVIKGSVTLRINNSFFDGPLSPLCWLRQTSVPSTELHLYPYFTSGSTLFRVTGTPVITRNPDTHKISVVCQITSDSGSSDDVIQSFSAEDMSIFEFVEVDLREGETSKGKGTTTQSEADSSDDN